jgi:acyl-coenzyme A thioesterase PaaI-like protein
MSLVDRIPPRLRPEVLRRVINIYPPYLGAGIRVVRIAPDWREIVVEMRLRWFNRNYVGTHFGGSLYSMTDPFFMLILIHRMGKEYIIWDRSCRIDFEAPGRGVVRVTFRVTDDELDDIRRRAAEGDKVLPTFQTQVLDERGEVVAKVTKTLYVRRKRDRLSSPG